MFRRIICFVSFGLLLVMAAGAQGTTYYVSPSGNDNNSGTSTGDAWATTDKVNSMTFSAGDGILFEGGETFSGGLVFGSSGTAASPIVVSSYGTGRATIQGDFEEIVLYALNCAGYEISDMIFRGSGNTGNQDNLDFCGIKFYNTSGVELEYVRIDNVEVSGVRGWGIVFDGDNFKGFRDVHVTNCEVCDIGCEGINSATDWQVRGDTHHDFYIANCKVYNVTGVPGHEPHSGNGIVLGGVDGAVIEFCEVWNCGQLNDAGGGGPIAIWVWESKNVLFQFNEAYGQKTKGGDGGGFDLDMGSSYCTMQYNYSHDNYGCGVLIMQYTQSRYSGDHIFRYNISANDSQYQPRAGGVAFYASATLQNVEVYNNTFYGGPDSTCLLYTSPSPRDRTRSRMPSSA